MLKTYYSRYSKKYDFSQNIDFLSKILSKIVVKKLAIIIMAIASSKIYPACQTDENGIKTGSNLNNNVKRNAELSRAEFLGIK